MGPRSACVSEKEKEGDREREKNKILRRLLAKATRKSYCDINDPEGV